MLFLFLLLLLQYLVQDVADRILRRLRLVLLVGVRHRLIGLVVLLRWVLALLSTESAENASQAPLLLLPLLVFSTQHGPEDTGGRTGGIGRGG